MSKNVFMRNFIILYNCNFIEHSIGKVVFTIFLKYTSCITNHEIWVLKKKQGNNPFILFTSTSLNSPVSSSQCPSYDILNV